ncbi:hypothetical protein DWZ54_02480 [Mitsuokella sp. AF33-22]|uniref:IS66 family transposase zinc-finger binding domain-containing protein n=1 Tax=Mitsuokella sp. AF33-22 TaxID=2292047 RepID=UPI000E4C6D5A|nr:transposase [Mitsuokella sp. AF33-22]RHM56729.1 hypothetical protein DWZ54_02480 [Mitsuokella sp. AF33-22]
MLKAQIARLQKMVYGARTKRTKRILLETANEQMDLFNETESRRRKMRPNRASMCPHVCKRCSVALTTMGKEKLRTEIEFIPAKIKIIDYCCESFQCLTCRKEEHFSIENPAMPLVSRLQQGLLEQDIIHADETPVQVHKEKGRKNWLFSDSPKEAKANGLNPFQYLFKHLSNADIQQHPKYLDDVLPWNETIQ